MLDVLQRGPAAVTTIAAVKRKLSAQGLPAAADIDTDVEDAIAGSAMAIAGQTGMRRPPWLQLYRQRWRSDAPVRSAGALRLDLARWPAYPVSLSIDGDPVDLASTEMLGRCETLEVEGVWRARLVELDYWAGWVAPAQLVTWTPYLGVEALACVERAGVYYVAKSAGTTGATEPAWGDGDVVDGTATWCAPGVTALPDDLRVAGKSAATDWYFGALDAPAAIASEAEGGARITYRANARPFSSAVQMILEGYR